jgi:GGDEF domain-containing protein
LDVPVLYVLVNGNFIGFGASSGSAGELLEAADVAIYRAKRWGKDGIFVSAGR